jgi:hypothetical protein
MDLLKDLTDEQFTAVAENLAVTQREFPSLFIRPNIAQYRTLIDIYSLVRNRTPDMISVEYANGVGKTTLDILDIIGWTMGPEFLQENTFPEVALAAYRDKEARRDAGKLALRMVCSAVDMKEGGSVCAAFKEFFPWAKLSERDNTGCYKRIDIPHPVIPGVVNHIAVLTFDQDKEKHSGSNCDRIWINENLPEELWGETNARTRAGGNIVQSATILEHSTHLDELEDSEVFILVRCRGHIYENCLGEEVTEEMADEVYREIGIRLEKNPDGPGYITYGTLSCAKIQAMCDGWLKSGGEDEVRARKTGRPYNDGTKIFPLFNKDVHVVAEDTFTNTPKDWPIAMFVDPHPARPAATIWALILSSDKLAIIDEWPTFNEMGYWDKIKESRFPVKQACGIWTAFEASRGYSKRIGDNRVGDPNMFANPNMTDKRQLKDLYADEGFVFNLQVNDDFEYGRELVNQYLWFDANVRKLAPSDPAGQPRLVVAEHCVNTIRAVSMFARKKVRDRNAPPSEAVDKRFACFAALVRYLCVWHQNHHFADIRVDPNRLSDYELVKLSRIPPSLRSKAA